MGTRDFLLTELRLKSWEPTDPLNLDSMDIMGLCVSAEQKLGVEISFQEIKGCLTFGELEAVVSSKEKK